MTQPRLLPPNQVRLVVAVPMVARRAVLRAIHQSRELGQGKIIAAVRTTTIHVTGTSPVRVRLAGGASATVGSCKPAGATPAYPGDRNAALPQGQGNKQHDYSTDDRLKLFMYDVIVVLGHLRATGRMKEYGAIKGDVPIYRLKYMPSGAKMKTRRLWALQTKLALLQRVWVTFV